MELNLSTKQQLVKLLAKPAMVTQADAPLLEGLIKIYPYFQPLHLLLAKANVGLATTNHLAKATIYNGGTALHRMMFEPASFETEEFKLTVDSFLEVEDSSGITDEQDFEVFDEIAEVSLSGKIQTTEDEEVFEEIGEITAEGFSQHSQEGNSAEAVVESYDGQEVEDFEIPSSNDQLPEELEIESVAATDFFAFEENFEVEQPVKQEVPHPEEYNMEAEAQTVSKYDDDKMPYTFLWWLAKTRKEHEQIFQPYVTTKTKNANTAGELQQQYVEHIFHIQTPFTDLEQVDKSEIKTSVTHKGDEIIDTFIKNEPQIRPPKPEQINNENKAKKSAEDHNDLVSETLASIYIEQMLYHKAIETYEKLSLKFPEKSRYFADLIQSLEKKI